MTTENTYLSHFIHRIDVECPNCGARALVVSNKARREKPRFTCSSCGKNNEWTGDYAVIQTSGPSMEKSTHIALGIPYDCYFKIPLWYRFDFKEHVFFAYNIEHLTFQKDYIEDKLRQRSQTEYGWSNASLKSRLPKWLLNASNREELVKKINLLENK